VGGFVAVFKGALLLGLAPKDFVIAVGVEGRVNVNEVNAGVGQFLELFQIVAAINDAGVEEDGGFQFRGRARHSVRAVVGLRASGGQGIARPTFASGLFCHARRLKQLLVAVNPVTRIERLAFTFPRFAAKTPVCSTMPPSGKISIHRAGCF
jgi:hypothetical protein